MKKLSPKAKRFLLQLSRTALEHYFSTGDFLKSSDVDIPTDIEPEVSAVKGTFVTLNSIEGNRLSLRGCIGHILPVNPIYKDVIENTYAAAFNDPRFPPLTQEELDTIKIEISVLSEPKRYKYRDIDQLLDYLDKKRPGVVLKYGPYNATFLPQVWKQIKDPAEFLSQLCLKAGLSSDCWLSLRPAVFTYTVDEFSEK